MSLLSGLWTPAGSTQEYTLDCLGTDSVYMLVYYGGGCGTYKVSYITTAAPTATDNEPNNTFADALDLDIAGAASGLLGYSSGTASIDLYDYYRINVTDSVTLKIRAVLDGIGAYVWLYNGAGTYLTNGAIAYDTAKLDYLVTPGVYYIGMHRWNGCGSYSFSPTESNCPTPEGLIADPVVSIAAMLKWTPQEDANSYIVETRPIGGGWTSNEVTGNNYPYYFLTRCSNYEFRVKSVCAESSSFFSPVEPFMTKCAPVCPKPKEDTVTNITDSTVMVHWSGSRLDLSYEVFYRPVGTLLPDTVFSTDTFALLPDLMPDTDYEYAIRALCYDEGKSGLSGPSNFSTMPDSLFRFMDRQLELSIYPNPASSQVNIWIGSEQLPNLIRMYSVDGVEVARVVPTDFTVAINTELLSDGLYMIELESEGWKEIRPVVIQH